MFWRPIVYEKRKFFEVSKCKAIRGHVVAIYSHSMAITVGRSAAEANACWSKHQMETPPKPIGSIDDPDARITPWKPMEVTVPFSKCHEKPATGVN